MATQQELALQMIAQLRVLDPSVSADLGTPERKILDTVGEALAEAQIDLISLRGGLDLDSKYGDNLDRFLALFGFARKAATFATGFATFGRVVASDNDIRIPSGTQVLALAGDIITSSGDVSDGVMFYTTFDVFLPAGETSVAVPITALYAGVTGNVAAGAITTFGGTTVLGITSVTNEVATSGGQNSESDEELKVRFKTQVFRNLAGTRDQYLALSAATAFTTKANVIGPVSRYQEYIQVPPVDDATAYDVNNDGTPEGGNGVTGQFTSALSDVPYSKYIYTDLPSFVSNGSDAISTFYRPDVDFTMNATSASKNRGDTYREAGVTPALGPSVSDPTVANSPNVTFLNVYTGIDPDIESIRPNDVVLFEHSYLSRASRNDVENGVTNAVDVYIDGGNNVTSSVITTRPDSTMTFVNDITSIYHYDNYRRVGEGEHRPILGNVLLPLFWQPVTDVPDQIVVNDTTYLKNAHYWAVEDVSELKGTIRARSGIEWSTSVHGVATADNIEDNPANWTGPFVPSQPSGTPVPIEDYTYDRNIVDLQTSLEASRQVTTDVLAHKATMRYFKFDISVMYTAGANPATVNLQINSVIASFLQGTNFGQVIQLSDLLQAIHNISGVDNVRWSSDVPGGTDLVRLFETDINGEPLTNFILEQTRPGTAIVAEKWQAYFTGAPTSGTVTLAEGPYTAPIAPTVTASLLQTYFRTLTGNSSLTVTTPSLVAGGTNDKGTPDNPFLINYVTLGTPTSTPTIVANDLRGGPKIIDSDFFMADDELPALPSVALDTDTVPGFIIRVRAQNTFTRS